MGCASSKPEEEEDDDVVSICRERKNLMKSAVDRRHALADAHCKYYHSLYAVSAAIRLFVARHSSPSSPFLISFPVDPTCPPGPGPEQTQISNSNPMLFQQTPTQPTTHETISSCNGKNASVSRSFLGSSNVERENEEQKKENFEEREEVGCEQIYGGMGPKMVSVSPQRDYEWEFFNPFAGVKTEEVINNGFDHHHHHHHHHQSSDDELKEIREREGIPELEEDVEREGGERNDEVVNNGEVGHEQVENVRADGDGTGDLTQWEKDSFRMIDTPNNGRELLEVLKDVEDHFIRAYESGMEVSQLLEADIVNIQSAMEEIKESSDKLIQSTTWNQTTFRSSSRKSFLASRSRNSSTWTECKNDLFDDDEAMKTRSHSLTLGRLYAWEKKLYEEVKTGNETRKLYERKCAQLRNQDTVGDGLSSLDKTSAEVKDLYSRILVAIRRAETISEKIQILRDEELQPQIIKLLYGLMRTWKIMSDSHETQNKVILEVKSFEFTTYGRYCNDSHRLATLQLEAELQNWRACFSGYVSAQKAYIESLNGWVSKFVAPEVEFYSNGSSCCINSQPTLLVICHDWLASFEKLPVKAVSHAMKNFGKHIRTLWAQQGEEQQQKRRVDGVTKELDRRVHALHKAENTILVSKLLEPKSQLNMQRRVEYLKERKDLLELYRNRVDTEKAKHHISMQETQHITWNCFQTGFSSVFESLREFSVATVKIYSDLVTYIENAEVRNTKASNTSSYIEGMTPR